MNNEPRYVRFHLGDGTVSGARILNPDSMQRMQTPLGREILPSLRDRVHGVGQLDALESGRHPNRLAPWKNQGPDVRDLVRSRAQSAMSVLTNADSDIALGLDVTHWILDRFLGAVIATDDRAVDGANRDGLRRVDFELPRRVAETRTIPTTDQIITRTIAIFSRT